MKTKLHIVIIFTLSLMWLILPQGLSLGATTNQVSQFGITWTFDREYEYGQFANGDYWIIGPVTIIGIDPPSIEIAGRTKNGSMVNPSPTTSGTGYDSTLGGYDVNLNVAYDVSGANLLILENGSSLVSMISREDPISRPRMQSAAVLTILSTAPAPGSFRPSYSGTDKNIKYNKSDLNYSPLARLAPVGNTPDMATVERYFERPWIDHKRGYTARYQHPLENMPDYGREISAEIGVGALMLHLDFSNQQKETLLIRYVQLGIDLYGIVEAGGRLNWVNAGGHASGRKWPILFAGVMLNDFNMADIGSKSGDYLYSGSYGPGNNPPDYIHFGEDDQTFYVKDSDIYSSPYELYHAHSVYVNHGKVNVVEGSTTVTGVDTIWTSAAADTADNGNYFVVKYGKAAERGYDAYQYKVISVDTSNQTLELDEPFQGYTDNNVDYVISKRPWFGHGNLANFEDFREFTDEHKGMPEWGISYASDARTGALDWDAAYRQYATANAWAGFVLAAHIMDVKELWNHDALFDYQDRYMQIQKETYGVGHWARQWSRFTETMWDTYRASYGSVWSPAPAQDPIAVITADPISGEAPLTVYFDASSSSDPDGDIEKYEWDVENDGIIDAQGVTISYVYNTGGTYTAKLAVTDNQGLTDTATISIRVSVRPGLADGRELSCYNNMFNPLKGEKAIIEVLLKDQEKVSICLYDTKGSKIKQLADEEKEAGTYRYYWAGRNDSGNVVGCGLYFVHIQAGDSIKTKKIVVIK